MFAALFVEATPLKVQIPYDTENDQLKTKTFELALVWTGRLLNK